MTDRLSCCAPFCRRTRGDRKGDPLTPGMEWLCAEHWRLVPIRIKRRRAKLRRMLRRATDPHRRGRIIYADGILWNACKREAIERAAGI